MRQLDSKLKPILGLDDSHHIAYTDLYDALTTLQYHGKGWPPGMTQELYREVEDEALRSGLLPRFYFASLRHSLPCLLSCGSSLAFDIGLLPHLCRLRP